MILKVPGFNRLIKIERVSKFTIPKKRTIEKTFNKVFVIGFGKTGTSSMKRAIEYFGFKVGDQTVAEVLSEDWSRGRSDRIIRYCNTADAFQDFPFMMPGLYKLLDQKFPNSKFILTVRDSPDQWFSSLIKFHSNVFSSDKEALPSIHDLENAEYRYRGWTLDVFKFFWNYPEVPLYDEKVYKQRYIDYNKEVNEYFAGREKDFLEINVSRKNDFQKLRDFLSVETDLIDFPWENKTVSQ
jgi:hypothetical protein